MREVFTSETVLSAVARVPRPAAAASASPPGSAPAFQLQLAPSSMERQRPIPPPRVTPVGSSLSPLASQVCAPTYATLHIQKLASLAEVPMESVPRLSVIGSQPAPWS